MAVPFRARYRQLLRSTRAFDQGSIARCLAILLCLQGVIAIGMLPWSPRYAAVNSAECRMLLLAATAACAVAITLAPALLALLRPLSRGTRVALGIGQTLMALLLFYLGGRPIETRSGLVSGLALLGFNIDWVVLVSGAGPHNALSGDNTDEPESSASKRQKELAIKFQKALLHGGLSVVYQPIFRNNEQMIAVEALARWRDPQEGPIPPTEFIPVAEATGLIFPFSDWILREACEQMVQWTAIDPSLERLAVNVSVKHVWREDFVQTVENILFETGLPPNRLELEVTEGAFVNDFETVKRHLAQLRQLGVRVAIDDFGTGYSSLSRVGELDADALKVDRQFVQSASDSSSGVAVVQAIIEMAHSLKLSVIAEGVETQAQMSMLRNLNCDEMQGFLLARPQEPGNITAALRNVATAREARRPQLLPMAM